MFVFKPVQYSVSSTGFLFDGASASAGAINFWNGQTGGTTAFSLASGTGHFSAASVMNQVAFLFGGYNQTGAVASNVIQRFTGSSRSTEASTLATALGSPSATTLTDTFIFGGNTTPTSATSTIQRYSTTFVRSTDSATLSTSHSGSAASALSSIAYVFGGLSGFGGGSLSYLSSITSYNGVSTMVSAHTLSSGARYSGSTTFGSNIFIFGGENGSTVFNTIQRFSASGISTDSQTIAVSWGIPSRCAAFTLRNFMVVAPRDKGIQRYDGVTRTTDKASGEIGIGGGIGASLNTSSLA